jgi:hypothetical protein
VTDDRCSVRLTRRYDASIDEVWRALVDADARSRWLGAEHSVSERPGHVLEIEVGGSVARIALERDGPRTVLVLEQTDIPAPRGMRAMRLWTRALDRLEAA